MKVALKLFVRMEELGVNCQVKEQSVSLVILPSKDAMGIMRDQTILYCKKSKKKV